eukprot:954433-Prorocentrum_minimum.AAC.1
MVSMGVPCGLCIIYTAESDHEYLRAWRKTGTCKHSTRSAPSSDRAEGADSSSGGGLDSLLEEVRSPPEGVGLFAVSEGGGSPCDDEAGTGGEGEERGRREGRWVAAVLVRCGEKQALACALRAVRARAAVFIKG